MRIPNKITQAWLDKKGFQFIEHYSDTGWRAYFVTRRDKKRCTLIEAANGKRERVALSSLQHARPIIRRKGKWVVDLDNSAL